MKFEIQLSGTNGKKKHVIELTRDSETYEITLDGQRLQADALQVSPNTVSVILGGNSFEIHLSRSVDGKIKLQCGPQ